MVIGWNIENGPLYLTDALRAAESRGATCLAQALAAAQNLRKKSLREPLFVLQALRIATSFRAAQPVTPAGGAG
jgi:hypothetical protein